MFDDSRSSSIRSPTARKRALGPAARVPIDFHPALFLYGPSYVHTKEVLLRHCVAFHKPRKSLKLIDEAGRRVGGRCSLRKLFRELAEAPLRLIASGSALTSGRLSSDRSLIRGCRSSGFLVAAADAGPVTVVMSLQPPTEYRCQRSGRDMQPTTS